MVLKIIAGVVCLIISRQSFSQTCVIGKKTEEAIYVGADSREVFTKINATTHESYDSLGSTCKLYHGGKFNFAVLGQALNIEYQIARGVCEKAKTFDEAIENFSNKFGKFLQGFLEFNRKSDPAGYNKTVENNRPIISQTMFFGYENDSAVLAVVLFSVVNKISDTVKIAHRILYRNLAYGGYTNEIKDTIENTKTWEPGVVATIKNLINIEAAAHPKYVGGEISILKVKPDGSVEWIPSGSHCNISGKN
jgi:hypothetical protein